LCLCVCTCVRIRNFRVLVCKYMCARLIPAYGRPHAPFSTHVRLCSRNARAVALPYLHESSYVCIRSFACAGVCVRRKP
jgi:hypothetical protein